MKPLIFVCRLLFLSVFCACHRNNDDTLIRKTRYTQQDSLTINGFKFTKKEFNQILDNFPRLYQNEVVHPDSLYKIEYSNPHFEDFYEQNISFGSDAGQDRYFALYAYFLAKKNKGSKFEYLREPLNHSYQIINTIFERINLGGTYYIHQSSCIPAWVEFEIYQLNKTEYKLIFDDKTKAGCTILIADFNTKIADKIKMTDSKYSFENDKIEDLMAKLSKEIANDYVLQQSKTFLETYYKDEL